MKAAIFGLHLEKKKVVLCHPASSKWGSVSQKEAKHVILLSVSSAATTQLLVGFNRSVRSITSHLSAHGTHTQNPTFTLNLVCLSL